MSLPQPGTSTSEPPIQLSAAAIAEIRRLQISQTQFASSPVRLNLAPGGCEDFLYDLKFDPNPWDGDRLYPYADLEFVIHADILPKVQGLQLDYSEDLMGGGFRFYNPNAAKNCGCGNSFSVR